MFSNEAGGLRVTCSHARLRTFLEGEIIRRGCSDRASSPKANDPGPARLRVAFFHRYRQVVSARKRPSFTRVRAYLPVGHEREGGVGHESASGAVKPLRLSAS